MSLEADTNGTLLASVFPRFRVPIFSVGFLDQTAVASLVASEAARHG
jgi:hypothetical protein